MEKEAEVDPSGRLLARLQERYGEKADLLVYEHGHYILSNDTANAWRDLNSFMLTASLLSEYRLGNRHIVPNITLDIENWGNLIPLETFGYNPGLRMSRLGRNYLNVESLERCRSYMSRRRPDKHSTHGIIFGTGRKKTPPCMVGGTFYYAPGRLFVDFFLRASEVTKTLGADFHFFDNVIQQAVPEFMSGSKLRVRIHLSMAYQLAQWFPLIDIIMPGYPLDPWVHKYHMMCWKSLQKARNLEYVSKWKPEKRLHGTYRKRIVKFRTDDEGRVLSGPSFFPRPS
jgi:hypothetical protein